MHRIALWKLFLFALLGLLLGLLFLPRKGFASTNFNTGNTPTLQKSETINQDYFTTGGTVVVSGTVNGDVYAAGGNILINGNVNGDVLAAGGNVTVTGTVSGNVRVVGGQLVVAGTVGKNVSMAGGNVTIEDPAKIAGSLTAAGGAISILAPIGKGVTVGGNQVTIDTSIGGDVNAGVQKLDVTSGSHIAGSLNYWSATRSTIANNVAVKGVMYHQVQMKPQEQQKAASAVFSGFGIFWGLISLISSFIIGLLLLWLVPKYMDSLSDIVVKKLGTSLGIGILGLILTPVIFIFLLLTLIGIPLAIILLLGFIIFVLVNKIFISYTIGRKLLPAQKTLGLFIGLVIYSVISIIPILGGIWDFVALCVGLGAFMMMKKIVYTEAKSKKII